MNLDLPLAIRAFEVLLGWSLLLQSFEFLRLRQLDRVGDWRIQRAEVPNALVRQVLDTLYQPLLYTGMLGLRGALALTLMLGQAGVGSAVLLFIMALLILLRWRGAFNGGSDFMTLVGLTGLLLAHVLGLFTDAASAWRVAFWYVAVQSLSSYFVSGWVKLMRPEWRSGRALTVFLDNAVYGPLPANSIYRQPQLALLCSWGFTLWEGLFPLALLDVRLAAMFCTIATVFHFLVFWFFGLNRFFWAWLSTFPAILYCASV
jgi:hypothetical protein